MRRLRGSVRALAARAGRPVVFKNLVNSLRVAPLGTALPEALFVVIHRDLVANAASLLAGRFQRTGDYGRWWSAEPPEIDRLRALPPHEQVVEQIRAIDALIHADAERLGHERFHDVAYESLCADPAGRWRASTTSPPPTAPSSGRAPRFPSASTRAARPASTPSSTPS